MSYYLQTPVRIYVLWHSAYKDGERIARRIYHWFRMASGEGIPVYYRCADSQTDIDEIYGGCDHNVIIPLVDSNMVASFRWREFLEELFQTNIKKTTNADSEFHFLPVALDETAYQSPEELCKLNFIRAMKTDQSTEDEVLLSKLTESICQILRKANDPEQTDPVKIFLSHAKADGTEVPVLIKNFIQSETQCHAFFDENDIPYGSDFKKNIEKSLSKDSAGLLVVQGDHFADRPWCRKEIREFLTPGFPINVDLIDEPPLIPIMPAVVVFNFKGAKPSKTIPELGSSTCICWSEHTAREAVITLLREILFSNFYTLLAKRELRKDSTPPYKDRRAVMLNRPPDHIILQSIKKYIHQRDGANSINGKERESVLIHHPGHGLTGVERDGLLNYYDDYYFRSYSSKDDNQGMSILGERNNTPLFSDKFLAISVSSADDLLSSGMGAEHMNELLRFILKPLFKEQISLIYGGRIPNFKLEEKPWSKRVNFTQTFLELLLSERQKSKNENSVSGDKPKQSRFISRLVNVSAWPHSDKITINDEAQWIHTCSFIKLRPDDAELTHIDPVASLTHAIMKNLKNKIHGIICLSDMRRKICQKLTVDIPSKKNYEFESLAHLFLGGKLSGYSGLMPGIWEEILLALEAKKPCFIIGIGNGAAGKIVHLLTSSNLDEDDIDEELKLSNPPEAKVESYLVGNPSWYSSKQAVDKLKQFIMTARSDEENGLKKLLNNGLSQESNRELMLATNFQDIAMLVESGLNEVIKKCNS